MRYFDIVDNRLVESREDSARVLSASAPDDRDRARLCELFQLDEYDLASTVDPDEVPRVEVSNGRVLIIWKVPETAVLRENVELRVSVTGIVLLEDRVAFVRGADDLVFTDREFREVRDARDCLLALLLRTVRHFVAHLKVIPQLSRDLEKKITVSMENKHLLQMFSLSASLIYYLDAIEGNEAVLTKLRSMAPQHGFEARQLDLLDEIILENAQAGRQATILSSVLSGLMDARGTIVNNNMNVLLKNLTLINIVFLPLNLIASIGGMSEWSMMTRGFDWRLSYFLFSVGMVVLGWITWILVKSVIDRGEARHLAREAARPKLQGEPRLPP